MATPAFSFDAFSDDAFDTGLAPGFNFPVSSKDPNSMAVLGYTASQTLLYDYGDTEDFYVNAQDTSVDPWSSDFSDDFGPLVSNIPILYRVGSVYASQWFGLNGSNGLRVVYNPFRRAVW